jgi:hypothetical protein
MAQLTATEDWLYDEGEDCAKSVYVAKLDELKKAGEPIEARWAQRCPCWEFGFFWGGVVVGTALLAWAVWPASTGAGWRRASWM